MREMDPGELVAVLTTLMLPAKLPAAPGAKPAASERLCPGASVTAPEKPLTLKPDPVAATWEMVTEPVPVFVIANGSDPAAPTV